MSLQKKEINFDEIKKEYSSYTSKEQLFLYFLVELFKRASYYDYIILTTRRCFRLVVSLFKKYHDEYALFSDELWVKFISSQSLSYYKDKINDSSLLLVDDIMIHGKAVYGIYKKVKEFGAKNIDTLLLARNYEKPDYYYYATNKEYEKLFLLNKEDWQVLSNEIVDNFYENGQPYTSYIYGIEDFKEFSKQLQKKYCFEKVIISNIIKNEYLSGPIGSKNIDYCFYHSNKADKIDLIDSYILREYKYQNSKSVLIPYCELKPLTSEGLIKSWNNIIKNFSKDTYKLNSISDPIEIYKIYTIMYSLFIFITDTDNEYKYTQDMDKSYYDGFINDISDIIISMYNSGIITLENFNDWLISNGLEIYSFNANNDKLKNNIYYNKLEIHYPDDFKDLDIKEKANFLFKYFSSVSENELKLFMDFLSEFDTKQIDSIIDENNNLIPQNIILNKLAFEDYLELKSLIILLLDSGVISHVVKEFEDDNNVTKYVSTSIKVGEQSYRLLYAINPLAYMLTYRFYDIYSYINGKKEIDEESINQYIAYMRSELDNSTINCIRNDLKAINESEQPDILNEAKSLINSNIYEQYYSLNEKTYEFFKKTL